MVVLILLAVAVSGRHDWQSRMLTLYVFWTVPARLFYVGQGHSDVIQK